MTRRAARCLALVLLATVLAGPLATRGHVQPAPDAMPESDLREPEKLKPRDDTDEEAERQIRIKHADRGQWDPVRELFSLFGSIEFEDEQTRLLCDEAIYNQKDDTAACAGHIQIIEKDTVITGEIVNADFEAETIRIEGNARIISTRQPKKEGAEGEPKAEPRVTTITCDRVDYTYTDGKRRALAEGNLKVVEKDRTVRGPKADYDREKGIIVLGPDVTVELGEDDMKLVCQAITYREEEDTATCTGNIKLFDDDTQVTGEKVDISFEPEVATLSGNVTIVTTRQSKSEEEKAKQEGKTEKRVTTITCDRVDYTYTEGKRRAVATGNVKAVQKGRTLLAQKADYDRETGMVVLGDKVTVEAEDGSGNCTKATVHVDEDIFIMEPFSGWARRKKKEGAPQPAPQAQPAAESTPAPEPATAPAGQP